MANLLSELGAVVRLQDEYDTSFDDEARIAIGQREDTLASNFLRDYHAEIAAAVRDSERLAVIASGESLAINRWLVQFIAGGKWDTAYFANPTHGTPDVVHASKLDALRAVADAAMSAREGQG